ncbi:unnamed protein product, partial [Choristocarpus tenellus]
MEEPLISPDLDEGMAFEYTAPSPSQKSPVQIEVPLAGSDTNVNRSYCDRRVCQDGVSLGPFASLLENVTFSQIVDTLDVEEDHARHDGDEDKSGGGVTSRCQQGDVWSKANVQLADSLALCSHPVPGVQGAKASTRGP